MVTKELPRPRASTEVSVERRASRFGGVWLLVIWALALIARILLSQATPAGRARVIWGDEPFYLWLGRNWITGNGYGFVGRIGGSVAALAQGQWAYSADVHHGPLFPMLAGLFYLVTHDMILSSEIIYVLFGSLLVFPVYALGRALCDERVALIGAALTATFPSLTTAILHWGTMTEPLYNFSPTAAFGREH